MPPIDQDIEEGRSAQDRFLAILGSTTPPGRFHSALLAGLEAAGYTEDVLVDLAEVEIVPAGSTLPAGDSGMAALLDRIDRAEVVLLASPVYRGSITGTLKNLLDHVSVGNLSRTVVPIVTMGGSDHHYLGADRHVRDLLTFFGAATLPTSLYLNSSSFSEGRPSPETVEAVATVIEASIGFADALIPLDSWGTPPLYS